MKWVMHKTNSRRDPAIKRAMNRWGIAGYGYFWILVELLGENHNENSVGKLLISWVQVQQELHLRRTSVQLLLNFFQEEKKVLWEDKGENVFIYMPKFINYSDTYTKRVLRQNVRTEKDESSKSVLAYKKRLENKEDINSDMDTTKAGPLARLVAKSFNKLIRRGGE